MSVQFTADFLEALGDLRVQKLLKNTIISAITHSPDVAAAEEAADVAAIKAVDVLTTGNLPAAVEGPLDQWARDRAYEADLEVEKHEAPPPPPPPPDPSGD